MKTQTSTDKKTKTGAWGSLEQWLTLDQIFVGGIILFIVGVVVILALNAARYWAPPIDVNVPEQSRMIPVQGAQHIGSGETHEPYNSNPPTSGPHYSQPAKLGVYQQTIPDEQIVHNLEHGGIWISYRDATDEQTIYLLNEIAQRYPSDVILTYRPLDDAPIAVAAWGRLLTLGSVEVTPINNFILRFRMKGPENVP